MARPRRFDLEDAVTRPGTYFNPQTEVLLVVDDSATIDIAIFEDDEAGDDWVLVSDEVPVDETARDDVVERFEARHHPGASGAVDAAEDDFDEVDELEADDEEDEDDGVEELEGF